MKKEVYLDINGNKKLAIIERKKIKSIRWVIKDGIYMIRCPYFCSVEYLEKVISNHKSRKKPLLETPMNDEYCYVYGIKQDITSKFVVIDGHHILFNKDTFYKDIDKFFKPYIESRLKFFENLMNIKTPYRLTTRFVSTRYGSNSRNTHHITINSFLIHFSKKIIDAIIIHELAHNFYYDHSDDFYNFVYKYCPNYDEIHKALRLQKFNEVNK